MEVACLGCWGVIETGGMIGEEGAVPLRTVIRATHQLPSTTTTARALLTTTMTHTTLSPLFSASLPPLFYVLHHFAFFLPLSSSFHFPHCFFVLHPSSSLPLFAFPLPSLCFQLRCSNVPDFVILSSFLQSLQFVIHFLPGRAL